MQSYNDDRAAPISEEYGRKLSSSVNKFPGRNQSSFLPGLDGQQCLLMQEQRCRAAFRDKQVSDAPNAQPLLTSARAGGPSRPSPIVIAAVPLSYFAAALFGIYFTGQAGNVAALWLSGSILLTALIRHEPATWSVLLPLTAAADVAANVLLGSSFLTAVGIATA